MSPPEISSPAVDVPCARLHARRERAPSLERLEREGAALARELLPGLERPRAPRPAAPPRARAAAPPPRTYAINRRLEREGRGDLRPLYFIWTLLRTCNFACTYCDDHRGQRYPELPSDGTLDTARALELLRVLRTGLSSVYFAGGEPTLRKDLPELTRRARDLAYHPIFVNTNASIVHRILGQPRYRTWLADTDVVVVSLDAVELDELARTYGTDSPEDVLRNLFLLRALAEPMRFKLLVNCVLRPGKAEHAQAVLALAERLGVWFTPVPMNVGPRASAALRDDAAHAALVELILARKRAGARITGSLRMNERLLRSAPLDCRNTLKPHVDHDGMLYWPCKASVNVEPVRLDVLAYPDVESIWAEGRRRVEPTRFHGPAKNQCGADCNWAQNYSTDAYAHGLTHPLSLLGELAELWQR
jgi:molybdenum cofactor biosynthesis enzyme MoaA